MYVGKAACVRGTGSNLPLLFCFVSFRFLVLAFASFLFVVWYFLFGDYFGLVSWPISLSTVRRVALEEGGRAPLLFAHVAGCRAEDGY